MRTIQQVFGLKNVPEEREVGVEIEMEGRNLPMDGLPIPWRGTADGSLRGHAVEYVMARPVARGQALLESLSILQAHLKDYGARLLPSPRCGVHVHINCQHMTEKQVMCFALLFYIVEEVLIKFCAPSREDNLFCLRAKDATDVLRAVHKAQRTGDLRVVTNDRYRYASLNFSSLPKYGSLEFRALESPKDFQKVYNWAQLLLRVKDSSFEYGNTIHILESISGMGGRSFFRHIMGDLASSFEEHDLDTLIMDGVRRVQHIVYTEWPDKKKEEPLGGWGINAEHLQMNHRLRDELARMRNGPQVVVVGDRRYIQDRDGRWIPAPNLVENEVLEDDGEDEDDDWEEELEELFEEDEEEDHH